MCIKVDLGIKVEILPVVFTAGRHSEACSHRDQKRIEALFRNWQVIFLQYRDVESNGLTNLADGFFASLPLAHATRKAQAFGHPLAIFAPINHGLSHLHSS